MQDIKLLDPNFTFADLEAMAKPLDATGPEQFPHWLYDSQTFTFATDTKLTFFQNVNADKTLCNLQLAASLPQGEYFWPQYATFDPLFNSEVGAATLAGMWDEINRFVHTSHPSWTFSIKSKSYGPWPLSLAHGSGGAVGAGLAAIAGPLTYSQGNNGVQDGGQCINGIPIIPPNTAFIITVNWGALVTGNVAATVLCRFTLAGAYFRQVA